MAKQLNGQKSEAGRVQRWFALLLAFAGAGLVGLFAGTEILGIGYAGLGALQLAGISIGLTLIGCAHVLMSRGVGSLAMRDLPWMLGVASMVMATGALWFGLRRTPPRSGGEVDGLAERLIAVERLARTPRRMDARCLPSGSDRRPRVALEPVVDGLRKPVYVTTAGDGTGRLFIVEKGGTIRIAGAAGLDPVPFLDIRERVVSDDLPLASWEQGLLNVAFPPDYSQTGRFYVHYTAVPDGTVKISRFVVSDDPNRADPNSETEVLAVQTVGPNHNGGQLQFGTDGYLYAAIGDGNGYRWPHGDPEIYGDGAVQLGEGGVILFPPDRTYTEDDVEKDDPWNQAQDLSTLRGKILRLDVSGDSGYAIPTDNPFAGDEDDATRGEIWAYGLRNPWRFSFDGCDESLFVGDVGRSRYEEVNLVRPGENYGWKIMEGSHCYPPWRPETCSTARLEFPITEYGHLDDDPSGGNAIIGGYVYRGERIPGLVGRYLFGDFMSGRIWTLTPSGHAASGWRREELMTTDFLPASFGLDANGELLVVEYGGRVHRLIPRPAASPTQGVDP